MSAISLATVWTSGSAESLHSVTAELEDQNALAVTTDLLELMDDQVVYMLYRQVQNDNNCWFLLWEIARIGYRMALLSFDIWPKCLEVLQSPGENLGDRPRILRGVLDLLTILTNQSADDCFPNEQEKVKPPKNDKAVFIGGPQLKMLCIEYKMRQKSWIEALTTEVTFENRRERNEQFLKAIEPWFNASEFATRGKFIYEELHFSVKDAFLRANFELLFTTIAKRFGNLVILHSSVKSLEPPIFLTRANGSMEQRFQLLARVVDLSSDDRDMFLNIIRTTNLRKWLIDDFLTKPNADCYKEATAVANQLAYCERVHKEKILEELLKEAASSEITKKVQTLDGVLSRERRGKLVKRWGLFVLQMLEAGCVQVFIKKVLTEGIVEGYLRFGLTLLCLHEEEPERAMSVTQFGDNRREFIQLTSRHLRQICSSIMSSGDKLNNQLKEMRTACHFLNFLQYACRQCGYEAFYESADMDKGEKKIQKMPNWIEQDHAARIVYSVLITQRKDLLVRTDALESLDSATLEFFFLLSNLSRTSKINFSTVLFQMGEVNVFTLVDDIEPDPIDIVVQPSEIVSWKLEDASFDNKNLTRGAFILSREPACDQFSVVKQSILATAKIYKQLISEKEEHRKQLKASMDQLEARMKRIGGTAQVAPALTRRVWVENLPSSSESRIDLSVPRGIPLACEGVFLYSKITGRCQKEHIHQKMNEFIKEQEPGCAEAWSLAATNLNKKDNCDDKWMLIHKLRDHVSKLLVTEFSEKKMHTMPCDNPNVQKLLTLKDCDVILRAIGYEVQSSNGRDVWLTTREKLESNESMMTSFVGCLMSIDPFDVVLSLDSSFSPVSHTDRMMEGRLPEAFFDTKDTQKRSDLSSLTIDALLQKLVGNSVLFKEVFLPYTLVRVTTQKNFAYQAVFRPTDVVSDVITRLRLDSNEALGGLEVNGTWMDWDMPLREISPLAIHFASI